MISTSRSLTSIVGTMTASGISGPKVGFWFCTICGPHSPMILATSATEQAR